LHPFFNVIIADFLANSISYIHYLFMHRLGMENALFLFIILLETIFQKTHF